MNHLNQLRFFPFFCSTVILEFAIKINQLLVNLPYMAYMAPMRFLSILRCSHYPLSRDLMSFLFASKDLWGLTSATCCQRPYDFQSMDSMDRADRSHRCGSENTRVNTQDQSCFFLGTEKSLYVSTIYVFSCLFTPNLGLLRLDVSGFKTTKITH